MRNLEVKEIVSVIGGSSNEREMPELPEGLIRVEPFFPFPAPFPFPFPIILPINPIVPILHGVPV
ncbi:hypothetical protein ABW636_08225 [Aquimarina sp. 2201CG1-2-11]|uniref:hypothetical protein n=1 Tax=Aquimarina discodermiae TaxID=3231043 RepID=UPI003462FA5D